MDPGDHTTDYHPLTPAMWPRPRGLDHHHHPVSSHSLELGRLRAHLTKGIITCQLINSGAFQSSFRWRNDEGPYYFIPRTDTVRLTPERGWRGKLLCGQKGILKPRKKHCLFRSLGYKDSHLCSWNWEGQAGRFIPGEVSVELCVVFVPIMCNISQNHEPSYRMCLLTT